MLFEGQPNGAIDCETLDEAEDFTLTQIEKYYCTTDYRYCRPYSCGQIFGWQVEAGNEKVMITDVHINGIPTRIPVVGLSRCTIKELYLASNTDWIQGAYPHEMFHIIQDCNGAGGKESTADSERGSGHEGWEQYNIWNFIDMFRKGEL